MKSSRVIVLPTQTFIYIHIHIYIYIYIDISSVALILSTRKERLVEQNASGTKTTFRTESIDQGCMDQKDVKCSVFMISLISEGMGRRISKGIHGPESNKKALNYNDFLKVGSSQSVENISC